jgi:hypothetical protein
MSDKFFIILNCIVLGVDKSKGFQYILLDKDNKIPKILLDYKNYKTNINELYINKIKELIYVSDLELMPQIISFNTDLIPCEETTINVVYASVIAYTESIHDELALWKEFKFDETNDYSELIVDVIQKIK